MSDLWDIKQIASYYGKYAEKYDQEIDADLASYPSPFAIGSWTLEYLLSKDAPATTSRIKIFDVGCGTGKSSAIFFNHPVRERLDVTGMDATPEMLEKARSYPFVNLIEQNVEAFPLPSPFDAVVCVGVMDFIKSAHSFFLEIGRIVQASPFGVFGVTLPEGGDMNSFSDAQRKELISITGWRVIRYQRLMGYKDSGSGAEVIYHSYLLGR